MRPHLVHGSLDPRVSAPNDISIGSTVFAELKAESLDRHTEKPRYTSCSKSLLAVTRLKLKQTDDDFTAEFLRTASVLSDIVDDDLTSAAAAGRSRLGGPGGGTRVLPVSPPPRRADAAPAPPPDAGRAAAPP